MCGILKAHDFMTNFKKHGYKHHPAIVSELVKFLAVNTSFDQLEKMMTNEVATMEFKISCIGLGKIQFGNPQEQPLCGLSVVLPASFWQVTRAVLHNPLFLCCQDTIKQRALSKWSLDLGPTSTWAFWWQYSVHSASWYECTGFCPN